MLNQISYVEIWELQIDLQLLLILTQLNVLFRLKLHFDYHYFRAQSEALFIVVLRYMLSMLLLHTVRLGQS